MNPKDFKTVDQALQGLSLMKIPKEELENKMLDMIDEDKINQDLITGVLEELGSSANDWFCHNEFYHIKAFNPYLPKDKQEQIWAKEHIVKERLGFIGPTVFELSDEGFRLEDYNNCAPGEGLKLKWRRLPETLNELDDICTCWIGPPFRRGLIRSGKYLKPGEQKDENCALDMSMYKPDPAQVFTFDRDSP